MKMISLRMTRALTGFIMGAVLLAAGPALGGRISTCTTIDKPGSYVLTRNLAASGDCLVVAADFVTIDLAGWVITGDGSTGGGVTDGGAPRRGIAVRNGAITGFAFGVSLGATSHALVEGVRAIDHAEFGIVTGGGSTVHGNIARAFGNQAGTGIDSAGGSTIFGNTAQGFDCGIADGGGSTISGNTALGELGICAGPVSTIFGNTSNGGGPLDSSITAGTGSTIFGNAATGAGDGIRAGVGSSVIGNTARSFLPELDGTGIRVGCPSNVIGNTATGFTTNLVLGGEGCSNTDNVAPSPENSEVNLTPSPENSEEAGNR